MVIVGIVLGLILGAAGYYFVLKFLNCKQAAEPEPEPIVTADMKFRQDFIGHFGDISVNDLVHLRNKDLGLIDELNHEIKMLHLEINKVKIQSKYREPEVAPVEPFAPAKVVIKEPRKPRVVQSTRTSKAHTKSDGKDFTFKFAISNMFRKKVILNEQMMGWGFTDEFLSMVEAQGLQLRQTSAKFFAVDNGLFDYDTMENAFDKGVHVRFSPLDEYNRPTGVFAVLNSSCMTSSKRKHKVINPVGWQQERDVNGNYIYHRGHLLGYQLFGGLAATDKTLDASEGNPLNIVTQTMNSNSGPMSQVESQLFNYMTSHKDTLVLFENKPIYRDDDLVALGFEVRVRTFNGELNFCYFVPNIAKDILLDYKTGYTSLMM